MLLISYSSLILTNMITRITITQTAQLSVTRAGYLNRGNSQTFATCAIDCLTNAEFYQVCSALMAEADNNPDATALQLFKTHFNNSEPVIKVYSTNKTTYSGNGITITEEKKDTQFIG